MDAILTINPGTTTTRLGLYAPEGATVHELCAATLEHDEGVMAAFARIADQLEYRAAAVGEFLTTHLGGAHLVAVAGRGGMLSPVPAGVIGVNAALVDFALNTPVYQHASNLGAPLAARLARAHNIPAFVVDPVSVDQLPDHARLSGFPDIDRFSFVHALNIRACARRYAAEIGRELGSLDAVVAHLGAGISIAALKDGRIVESSNRMENSPFSPERAGGLPIMPLIELCYSGQYSQDELKKRLYGQGGVFGYLGTKDMRRVEAMIAAGNARAELVWQAMMYQITKAIGAMAAVLDYAPQGVILTGGMAASRRVQNELGARVAGLAPLRIYPGGFENEALAEGAARVLAGLEVPMVWPVRMEATNAQL